MSTSSVVRKLRIPDSCLGFGGIDDGAMEVNRGACTVRWYAQLVPCREPDFCDYLRMVRARVGHSVVLVVTLALTSCAHEAPLAPPPPAPVLAEVAPVTVEPTAEPAPLSDGPAILAAVCTPVWAVHEDGSRRIACTTHGPYAASTRFTGTEIGEHKGDPLEVCELASVARGAFTHVGAREVLLAFADCKERLRASPFVVVLAEEDAGKYRPVAYLNELRTERCEKTRRTDGRDVFYCESVKKVEHVGIATTYAVVDFAHTGRFIGSVATLTQHDFDCAHFQTNAVNTMPKGYVWMKPPTFHTDAGKLVIDVERTFAPPSPTLDGQLGAECQKHAETDGLAALPPPRKETLSFEPRTDSYVPTGPTKLLLDQWARELSDYRLRSNLAPVWAAGKK